MNMTYELNNIRKDADLFDGKFNKSSKIVEVFSALVNGDSLDRFSKDVADKSVAYIKELGSRAENGDSVAVTELNTLRRFVVEAPVMEELRLLGIFGAYQNVGFDDNVEREVYNYAGEPSREQAEGGDVVFPSIVKETYPIAFGTVSGGYAVDYRRVAAGDMSKENEGLALVRTDIRNKAVLYVVNKIYNAIKNATGVKYQYEFAGLTKAGMDAILNAVRRNGKPTVIADYAVLSQFSSWAGYKGEIGGTTITGMSQKVMDELAANGVLSQYNGAILAELPNPYNEFDMSGTWSPDGGTHNFANFTTLLPAGLGFVVPAGVQSPIKTWTRGGLTSLTGNNVKNGKIETRFDLSIGCDIAKGQEHKIGCFKDTNI